MSPQRLVPVYPHLLQAAGATGEIDLDVSAYELMRGVGNPCAGEGTDARYNTQRLVRLLIRGLGRPALQKRRLTVTGRFRGKNSVTSRPELST